MDDINGRPLWYGLDHRPISMSAGLALLRDIESRRIAIDLFGAESEIVAVSTVFTVLDHNIGIPGSPDGPVLYETMILGGGPYEGWQKRVCTREEAKDAHAEAVALLTSARDSVG